MSEVPFNIKNDSVFTFCCPVKYINLNKIVTNSFVKIAK